MSLRGSWKVLVIVGIGAAVLAGWTGERQARVAGGQAQEAFFVPNDDERAFDLSHGAKLIPPAEWTPTMMPDGDWYVPRWSVSGFTRYDGSRGSWFVRDR